MMEDAAAMVGLALAYAGITLTLITGSPLYDGIASILIGLLLATVASFLGREMKSLLVGEAALPEEEETIRAVLTGHEGVREVLYVRTLYYAPEDLLVEAKVSFDRDTTFAEIVAAINEMEEAIRSEVEHAGLISIEPDVAKPEDVDAPAYERDRS